MDFVHSKRTLFKREQAIGASYCFSIRNRIDYRLLIKRSDIFWVLTCYFTFSKTVCNRKFRFICLENSWRSKNSTKTKLESFTKCQGGFAWSAKPTWLRTLCHFARTVKDPMEPILYLRPTYWVPKPNPVYLFPQSQTVFAWLHNLRITKNRPTGHWASWTQKLFWYKTAPVLYSYLRAIGWHCGLRNCFDMKQRRSTLAINIECKILF